MDPVMATLRRLAFGGDGKPTSELFTRDYHAYQTVRNLRDKSLLSVLSLWWIRDEMERIRLLVPAEAEALERVCEYLSMLIDTQHGCFDIADRFNTVIRLGVGAIDGDVRENIRRAKRFQQEHCVPHCGQPVDSSVNSAKTSARQQPRTQSNSRRNVSTRQQAAAAVVRAASIVAAAMSATAIGGQVPALALLLVLAPKTVHARLEQGQGGEPAADAVGQAHDRAPSPRTDLHPPLVSGGNGAVRGGRMEEAGRATRGGALNQDRPSGAVSAASGAVRHPSPPPATPEERAARPVMFAKLVATQVLILASPPPPSCSSNTQHPVHTRSVPASATMGSKATTAATPADEGNPAAKHTTDSRTNPPPPTSRASPQRRRRKHRRAHQRPTHSQYVSPWRLEPKLEAGQPTGEFRFICDMRHLNDHVQETTVQIPAVDVDSGDGRAVGPSDVLRPTQLFLQFPRVTERPEIFHGPGTTDTATTHRPQQPTVHPQRTVRIHGSADGIPPEPVRGLQGAAVDRNVGEDTEGVDRDVCRRSPTGSITTPHSGTHLPVQGAIARSRVHHPPHQGVGGREETVRVFGDRSMLSDEDLVRAAIQVEQTAAGVRAHVAPHPHPRSDGTTTNHRPLGRFGDVADLTVTDNALVHPVALGRSSGSQLAIEQTSAHPSTVTGGPQGDQLVDTTLDDGTLRSTPSNGDTVHRRQHSRFRGMGNGGSRSGDGDQRGDRATGRTRGILDGRCTRFGPDQSVRTESSDSGDTSQPPHAGRTRGAAVDGQSVSDGRLQLASISSTDTDDRIQRTVPTTVETSDLPQGSMDRYRFQRTRRHTEPSQGSHGIPMGTGAGTVSSHAMGLSTHSRLFRSTMVQTAGHDMGQPLGVGRSAAHRHDADVVDAQAVLVDPALELLAGDASEDRSRPGDGSATHAGLALCGLVSACGAVVVGQNRGAKRTPARAASHQQSGTARAEQKQTLGLRAVADGWLKELRPAAQELWRDLVAERQAADPRFGSTRALLTFSRLSANSWNQYTTALRSFCDFCKSCNPPITIDQVKPQHLTDYVCWLAERANPLKYATVASYLSGIRSVLTECGIPLPPDAEIRSVLEGYKRWRAAVQEPEVKRPAWPARWTTKAIARARDILYACTPAGAGKGTLYTFPVPRDHEFVVYTAYVVLASVCFSRGDTVIMIERQHVSTTEDGGLCIKLNKQKRPRDFIPDQVHQPSTDSMCPIQFLTDCYLPYLDRVGYGPTSRLFAMTAQAKARSLDTAIKTLAADLNIGQHGDKPWTGHCVRIGAISEAFAVGVPLAKIAHFANHKSTTTTESYVRHDVVADHAAQTFFGRLVPQGRRGDAISL